MRTTVSMIGVLGVPELIRGRAKMLILTYFIGTVVAVSFVVIARLVPVALVV